MKIAVVGASGNAGSRITAELSRRGHAVTAIARNPDRIAAQPNVTADQGDVLDQAGLTQLLAGHDVAISSVHFLASDPAKLIGAAKDSKVGRYLVVGGAGSLEVAPGVRLVTTPGFPAAIQGRGREGRGLSRPVAPGKGAELDLPVALGAVHGGRADRQVPARDRSAFGQMRTEKAGFPSRTSQLHSPTKSSGRPISASGLRSATRRRTYGPLRPRPETIACARPWGRSWLPQGPILSVTTRRYIRRARTDPVCRAALLREDGLALEKLKNYRPSEKEPFMNERQRDYFRAKLLAWKDEILQGIEDHAADPAGRERQSSRSG